MFEWINVIQKKSSECKTIYVTRGGVIFDCKKVVQLLVFAKFPIVHDSRNSRMPKNLRRILPRNFCSIETRLSGLKYFNFWLLFSIDDARNTFGSDNLEQVKVWPIQIILSYNPSVNLISSVTSNDLCVTDFSCCHTSFGQMIITLEMPLCRCLHQTTVAWHELQSR
jgi:hypothetical protein